MKNSSLFILVFSLIFLKGCSAIKDLISGGEVPDVSSYDTDSAKDQVLSSVTASVSYGQESSENGAAIQGNNLESESLSQIDSLKEKLLTDGSVKINPAEAYLIDYLRPKQNQTMTFTGLATPKTKRNEDLQGVFYVKNGLCRVAKTALYEPFDRSL